MSEQEHSNLPLSEQYRTVAKRWVDADEAASLMEETKSIIFSEMTNRLLVNDINLAHNRAETIAKSSPEWREFVQNMVKLRSRANLLKAQLEYLRMRHAEQQSSEATARAEMRL